VLAGSGRFRPREIAEGRTGDAIVAVDSADGDDPQPQGAALGSRGATKWSAQDHPKLDACVLAHVAGTPAPTPRGGAAHESVADVRAMQYGTSSHTRHVTVRAQGEAPHVEIALQPDNRDTRGRMCLRLLRDDRGTRRWARPGNVVVGRCDGNHQHDRGDAGPHHSGKHDRRSIRFATVVPNRHQQPGVSPAASASPCHAFEHPGGERHVRSAPYMSLLEREGVDRVAGSHQLEHAWFLELFG
jgi:hypothetical protein